MNYRIYLSKEFPNNSNDNFLINLGNGFELAYYIDDLTYVNFQDVKNGSWNFNLGLFTNEYDLEKSYSLEEIKEQFPEYFI